MLAGDPLARRVTPGILAAEAATRLRPRWCRGRGSGEPAQGDEDPHSDRPCGPWRVLLCGVP